MAKLKKDEMTAEDLNEFVRTNSDFAFEMRVLTQLRADGFDCSHSGTYRDPVTDKIRQFDIRATIRRGDSALGLAVECKNLRSNNPLLLSSVPRTASEAFHEFLEHQPQVGGPISHRLTGENSFYRPGLMVGKNTDQVGRNLSGRLDSNDEATFEKLNQAVNSCHDFVRSLSEKASPRRKAVVPLLVVPSGLLWQVEYSPDGVIATKPHQVKRATLFLDHAWPVPGVYGSTISYRLSHVEFVTFEALPGIGESYFGPGGFFPFEGSPAQK